MAHLRAQWQPDYLYIVASKIPAGVALPPVSSQAAMSQPSTPPVPNPPSLSSSLSSVPSGMSIGSGSPASSSSSSTTNMPVSKTGLGSSPPSTQTTPALGRRVPMSPVLSSSPLRNSTPVQSAPAHPGDMGVSSSSLMAVHNTDLPDVAPSQPRTSGSLVNMEAVADVAPPHAVDDAYVPPNPLHLSFFIPSGEDGTQGRWITVDTPQDRTGAHLLDLNLGSDLLPEFPNRDRAGRVPHAISRVAHLHTDAEKAAFNAALQRVQSQENMPWFVNFIRALAAARILHCDGNAWGLVGALDRAAVRPFDGAFYDCSHVCGPAPARPGTTCRLCNIL